MAINQVVLLKHRLRLLFTFLRSLIRTKILKYPVLYNVKKRRYGKRALLVYLVPPFLGKFKNMHHNEIRNILISNALDRVGFIVDVVDVRSLQKPKIEKYDLIIGECIDLKVKLDIKNSVKIFFATGKEHKDHNRALQQRYKMLMERRKIKLKPSGLLPEKMPYVEMSDYIIGIGNKTTIDNTYIKYTNIKKIFRLNNHIYKDTQIVRNRTPESKNNFMFISSFNPVRGGLDLLLEIFPKYRALNLYILGYFFHDRDFCRLYSKELFETPNIHPIGFVSVLSKDFYDIARRCRFAIVPTCSEGQSSSILQSAATGLIPITTKDSGIEISEYKIGFEISEDISEIEKTVLRCSQMSEGELEEMSQHVAEVCREEFSEQRFEDKFHEVIIEIARKEHIT